MSTFHLFPRLVPEVRQRIWQLSLEPRVIYVERGDDFNYDVLIKPEQRQGLIKTGVEIVKKGAPPGQFQSWALTCIVPGMDICFTSFDAYHQYLADRSAVTYAIFKASPPAGFSVCRESRSCLLPMFSEILPNRPNSLSGGVNLGIPTWMNFTMDTIHCIQDDLPYIARMAWVSQIQRMIVDVNDSDTLYDNMYAHLRSDLSYIICDMTGLKDLIIRDMESRWNDWYDGWYSLLADIYNRCETVSFYLRIINPNFPNTEELNPANFMSIWQHANGIEDSGEDFDVLNHPFEWIHNGKDCLTKCGKVTERYR